jgi:hypothetical protein
MHHSKITDAKLCVLQVLASILCSVRQLIIVRVTLFQIMLAQCLITGQYRVSQF